MKKEKGMTISDHIKTFDFYKDLPQELQEPSVSGASGTYKDYLNKYVVSMLAMILMAGMFLS